MDNIISYEELLDEAHKKGIKAIRVKTLVEPSGDSPLCIVHASVSFKDDTVFENIGDAEPENCNRMVRPHYIRIAATRAIGRCFKDALGIRRPMQEELHDDAEVVAAPRASSPSRQPAPIRDRDGLVDALPEGTPAALVEPWIAVGLKAIEQGIAIPVLKRPGDVAGATKFLEGKVK